MLNYNAEPQRNRHSTWISLAVVAAILVAGVLLLAAFRNASRDSHFTVSSPGPQEVSQAVSTIAAHAQSGALTMPTSDDRPSIRPVDPKRTDWVITKDYAGHGGPGPYGAVDYAYYHDKDACGSALVATHPGVVKTLLNDPVYGNLVYVVGKNYSTTYGHMQKIAVKDGQSVASGDVIGQMGTTGNSTGCHVDYQVWLCKGDPTKSGTTERVCVNKNPLDFAK